jgi:hypothetical protein
MADLVDNTPDASNRFYCAARVFLDNLDFFAYLFCRVRSLLC